MSRTMDAIEGQSDDLVCHVLSASRRCFRRRSLFIIRCWYFGVLT
ncbi:hypothetical protein [Streptomyces sp. NPDC001222]